MALTLHVFQYGQKFASLCERHQNIKLELYTSIERFITNGLFLTLVGMVLERVVRYSLSPKLGWDRRKYSKSMELILTTVNVYSYQTDIVRIA